MSGTISILDKRFRVLYGEQQIGEAVERIASAINAELAEACPVFVAVLNGSFMFAADLLKRVSIPCEISFVKMRSYEGTASSGNVKALVGLDTNIEGRTVVIVEDIVDTGLTLESLAAQLHAQGAGRVKVATLLFKPAAFRRGTRPDYVGFEVDNRFVVGYGMDYSGQGRNLKEVHVLA